MKLAITIVEQAAAEAPLVLRGQFADTFSKAAEIGYDAVELHIAAPAELNLQEMKELCNATGVSVASIGTGLAFVRDGLTLTDCDANLRRRATNRLNEFIQLGSELSSVVIIGLMKGYVRDCIDRSTYEQYLTHALNECLATAQQCGTTLVLEAVNRYECDTLNTIEECVRYIERFNSAHLKLHIDTFHMNIEEDHIGANIAAAGRHIGHVHIADSNRGYPGSGHYDFAETIAALKSVGYQGALSVECLALPTPDEAARRAYQFLQQVLPQATI